MISFWKLTWDPPKSWKDLIVSHVTITCVYRINKIKWVMFQDSKKRLHNFTEWVHFCNYYSILLCLFMYTVVVKSCVFLPQLEVALQTKVEENEVNRTADGSYLQTYIRRGGRCRLPFQNQGLSIFVNLKCRIETHPKVFLVFVD